jgi:hypothetical protein
LAARFSEQIFVFVCLNVSRSAVCRVWDTTKPLE